MLAKLMKYELKSTARLFLPFYAILLLLALLNRYLNPFKTIETAYNFGLQAIFKSFSITAYFVLIIAIFVMTLVMIIQRFYKNLLGDEGYLMFTLPVKVWQHITAKLLTAMIWCVMSAVTVVGSIFILVGVKQITEALPYMMDLIKQSFGYAGFVVIPLLVLLQLAAGIMMIYDAMALGHLFQGHRLLASFAMYGVLYFIQQIIIAILLLLLGGTLFTSLFQSAVPTPRELNLFLGMLALFGGIGVVAHFVITHYVLRRKLNLE